MFYSKLALKSLFINRRQYTSLFLVCLVGVALILSSVNLTDGMIKTVRYKARQYYGGDLQFLGGWELGKTNADEQINIIKKYVSNDVEIFKRVDWDASTCSIFFEGASVRQRRLKGVNFDDEKDLFKQFKFIEGTAASSPEHNTIIISQAIAKKLSCRVGDIITLQCQTIYGSTNTLLMQVSGIFQDTSLFGMYTAYLDIKALRSIMLFPDNYVNRINLFFSKSQPTAKQIKKLQENLSKDFHMFPLTEDKNEFYAALDSPKEEPLYALITLDANIKDLEVLIDAINSVIILTTTILVLIISIGIGSTYKVIVMKRITEIGTYRAIGMKPKGVTQMFTVETLFLLLLGFAAGILFSLVINFVISRFDFSFIPGFDMFLLQGHLIARYKVMKVTGILAIISVTTLLSVLFTIRDAVHISPVGALSTTN